MSEQDDVRQPGAIRPQERTDAPDHKPSGELGGQPVNADETAPREHMPDPHEGGAPGDRHPEAVEDEPGNDL
jgi:hypothetical protein